MEDNKSEQLRPWQSAPSLVVDVTPQESLSSVDVSTMASVPMSDAASSSSSSKPTSSQDDMYGSSLSFQVLSWLISQTRVGLLSTPEEVIEASYVFTEIQETIFQKRMDDLLCKKVKDFIEYEMTILYDAYIKECLLPFTSHQILDENDFNQLKQAFANITNFMRSKITTNVGKLTAKVSKYRSDDRMDGHDIAYQAALDAEPLLTELASYDLTILTLADLKKVSSKIQSANVKINRAESDKNKDSFERKIMEREKTEEIIHNIIIDALFDCLKQDMRNLYLATYGGHFDTMLYFFVNIQYKIDCLINLASCIFTQHKIPIEKNKTSVLLVSSFIDMFTSDAELTKLNVVKNIIDSFLFYMIDGAKENELYEIDVLISFYSIFQCQYLQKNGDVVKNIYYDLDYVVIYQAISEKYYSQIHRSYDNDFIHEEKIKTFLSTIVKTLEQLSCHSFENIVPASCFNKLLSEPKTLQHWFEAALCQEEQALPRSLLEKFVPFILQLLTSTKVCDTATSTSVVMPLESGSDLHSHLTDNISARASTTSLVEQPTATPAMTSSSSLSDRSAPALQRPHSDLIQWTRRQDYLKKNHSTSALPDVLVSSSTRGSAQLRSSVSNPSTRSKDGGVQARLSPSPQPRGFFDAIGRRLSQLGTHLPDLLSAAGEAAKQYEPFLSPLGSIPVSTLPVSPRSSLPPSRSISRPRGASLFQPASIPTSMHTTPAPSDLRLPRGGRSSSSSS